MAELWKNRDRNYREPRIEWPDLEDDPLWLAFRNGRDPYEALLEAFDEEGFETAKAADNANAWLKANRWRGKKAFLAAVYGITAESLAPQLDWTLEKTKKAIANLDERYPVIPALKALVHKQLVKTGMTRSLWGRPRRISGYFQLSRPNPLVTQFERRRKLNGDEFVRTYHAHIIPVGTWQQGTQAFLERCQIISTGQVVFEADASDLTIKTCLDNDAYIGGCLASKWQTLPFANNNFSQTHWVQEKDTGLLRYLPRQAKAERVLFNAIFQSTGADHLRWLMNNMDNEVCRLERFSNCKLILTVHDSLIYEVPHGDYRDFVEAATPILTRRPPWATLDIKVDATVGYRFGRMHRLPRLLL